MTGTHSRWFSSRTGRQYLGQTDRATDVTRSGGGRAGAEPGEVDPVLGSAAPPAEAGQDRTRIPGKSMVLGATVAQMTRGWSGVGDSG